MSRFLLRTSKMLDRLKKFAPDNFYAWMEFFFKILGLHPPKNKMKKFLYLLVALPHISMSTFIVTGLEWTKLFVDFHEDFKISMLTLSLCTLHSVFIFRIIFWYFTKEKLARVVRVVQRDSFEFDCFGIYTIKSERLLDKGRRVERLEGALKYKELGRWWGSAKVFLNQNKNPIEEYRVEKMAECRTICCCIYLFINFLSLSTIYVSYINVLDAEKYEKFNTKYNVTSTYRIYPYHMYFPFDTSVSHGFYWLGYFYQIYAYCSTMLTFLPIDTIVINSIIHLIIQTKIVGEAFNRTAENLDYTQSADVVSKLQEIRIVKCITELQNIYRGIYLLEDLCNVQLLVQYGASVFILCSLCYIIPLVNNIGEFICSSIFLSATLGEIFIFTYCSQTLSLELQKVNNAVYNLNWPDYSPKLRRNLVFLLSRLQKPCVLTAGKIFTLDLLFFIQVTQKSYSFYTLISNTSK